MIDEGRDAISIDYVRAIRQAKQVGTERIFIKRVGFGEGDARPGVFRDHRSFLNGSGRVAPIGVNFRPPDYQPHAIPAGMLIRLAL